MANGAKDAIAAMRRSHDELAPQVESLGSEGLTAQSACSEWTVAQVLSHLGSAAEIGLNTLKAGRNDMDAAPAIWDRWNAMSADEQATNFLNADRSLVEAYEALDDDELAHKKLDLGFLPAPVDISFALGMRLSEVGLHRWDIDFATQAAPTVPGYIVPFVMENLPMFAGFFAKPIGKSGRVAITATDPDSSDVLEYVLELGDDGASMSEGASEGTETHVSLPSEALLRLTSGRLDAEHTPEDVTVEGELSIDDLRRIFPGY